VKLSVRAFAIASGLLMGGGMLVMGLVNLASPGYGRAAMEVIASVYPGYHAEAGIGNAIVGTLYATVDGAIGGAVFAWLYNLLAGKG